MARVSAQASMSLDGFIEDSSGGGFDQLFAWHGNGDAEIPSADLRWMFHVSQASADYMRESFGARSRRRSQGSPLAAQRRGPVDDGLRVPVRRRNERGLTACLILLAPADAASRYYGRHITGAAP